MEFEPGLNPVTVNKGDTAVVYGAVTKTPENKFLPDFVPHSCLPFT